MFSTEVRKKITLDLGFACNIGTEVLPKYGMNGPQKRKLPYNERSIKDADEMLMVCVDLALIIINILRFFVDVKNNRTKGHEQCFNYLVVT